MHFIHLNARSLLPKISELRYLANKQKTAAIISVTETWLDSSVTNSEIKIEGYNIVRRDINRHGGGVCTYIHERYAFYTKEIEQTNTEEESIYGLRYIYQKQSQLSLVPVIVRLTRANMSNCLKRHSHNSDQIVKSLYWETSISASTKRPTLCIKHMT